MHRKQQSLRNRWLKLPVQIRNRSTKSPAPLSARSVKLPARGTFLVNLPRGSGNEGVRCCKRTTGSGWYHRTRVSVLKRIPLAILSSQEAHTPRCP
eukprot:3742010-Rhodomonas_salina.3